MKVKIQGQILSSKISKDNKPYIVLSQMSDKGFQELLKITTAKIHKVGDMYDGCVNIRALKTQDNRVMLRGWEAENGNI